MTPPPAFALAVVVVRPELIRRAQDLLAAQRLTLVAITPDNRGRLPQAIVDMVSTAKSAPGQ